MALLTGGMLFYAQIPVHSQFVSNLLPGYLLVGVGMALAFVAVSIAALSGVGPARRDWPPGCSTRPSKSVGLWVWPSPAVSP